MAIKQNDVSKRQATPPTGYAAGIRMTAIFVKSFAAEGFTAASDKLEIGMVPAGARVVGAQVIGEGLGVITADVGLMSGEFGSTDNARTVGNQLFNDQSVNGTEARATALACLAIPVADTHRGLGVTLSGDVAAGAGKAITVILEYVH